MLIRASRQHGVSLIELMIGLVIVGILLAVGAPSFSAFIRNSQIRNAAEAIQNGLNLARAEAVRRNTNVSFVLGAGSSWTVGCTTPVADADADGIAECPAVVQERTSAEGTVNASVAAAEVTAATGAAASSPVFSTTLNFNGFGRATTLPATSNAIFNISNPAAGTCVAANGTVRCLRVIATPAGQIRMCDPALTTSNPTDPQAC